MPNYQRLLVFPASFAIIALMVCCFLVCKCSCEKSDYGADQPEQTAAAIFQHTLRSKRHVADGVLDPYSVLGFLSFATFVFSVLYNNHKMKPAKSGGGGGAGPSGPPMLNTVSFTKLPDYTKLAALLRKVIKNSKQQLPMKEEVLEEYLEYDDSLEGDGIDHKQEDKQQST